MGKYPSDWEQRRRTVYKRDAYSCQRCGAGGGPNGNRELHAHHIVPISQGGGHGLDNLITLCRSCHNAIHGEIFAPSVGSEGLIDGTMPEPEALPTEVRPYFEYAHTYNDLANEYAELIDLLNELDEMLEAAVTLEENGEPLSPEFKESYIPKQRDVITHTRRTWSYKNDLLECSKDPFSLKLTRICGEFEEKLEESVETAKEYGWQRRKVVKGAFDDVEVLNTTNSEAYRSMIELREKHEEAFENSQEMVPTLQEVAIEEINEKLEKYPRISVRGGNLDETPPTSSRDLTQLESEQKEIDEVPEPPDVDIPSPSMGKLARKAFSFLRK